MDVGAKAAPFGNTPVALCCVSGIYAIKATPAFVRGFIRRRVDATK
jgi:hypothetical protein